MPASAQSSGTTGEFNYSPAAQARGGSVRITGKCVFQGATNNVDMIVTVQQGTAGDGSYGFPSRSIPADASGAINGTIEVPGDAPLGDYVIGGACRNGPTVFFSKNGPFAVLAEGTPPPAATTTTTAPRATTTTSTTVADETTTSTTLEDPVTTATTDTSVLETTVAEDDEDTTPTTVDEFAGTRNDDDDSIGPLLLLVGIVPLALAIGAVLLAMRRRSSQPAA